MSVPTLHERLSRYASRKLYKKCYDLINESGHVIRNDKITINCLYEHFRNPGPLMHVLRSDSSHTHCLSIMLCCGADELLNQWSSHPTPLIQTILSRRPIQMHMLIERGADVNYHCRFDITPLQVALEERYDWAVQYLLEQGAQIYKRSALRPMTLRMFSALSWGTTGLLNAFGTAIEIGKLENVITIVKHVTARGGHLEQPVSYRRRTPLMLAARIHRYKIVHFLLKAGAQLNNVDETGKTSIDLVLERLGIQEHTREVLTIGELLRAGAHRIRDPIDVLYPVHPQSFRLVYAAGFVTTGVLVIGRQQPTEAGEKTAFGDEIVGNFWLSHLARQVIRTQLKSKTTANLFAVVSKLPLPEMLKRYVVFNEVIPRW